MDKVKRKIYRSAVSGEIVTKDYALQNPTSTVCETVWLSRKPKVEYIEKVENETEK